MTMNPKKRATPLLACATAALLVLYSCASMGHPQGGPRDETPPQFLGANPAMQATGVSSGKMTLHFDEFIKIQNASEKVVVSPPQLEMPEIKANGRNVTIKLLDSLKSNTTYTVDFSDAIVDYNEGNPMGNFSYTFSTGEQIDSMEVSGTVLEAEDLEPIKGILVGLHSNLNDTAFTQLPFERLSRTDASGRFTLRGVAPGSYRLFALSDMNQNFRFDQKNEKIAFLDSLVVPYCRPDVRRDTLWIDSLTIDTVLVTDYTHYFPDDLVLRAFTEESHQKYLIKSERPSHKKFALYFSNSSDTLPRLRGLNFDENEAFVVESSPGNDTITYWLRDSLLYWRDTLRVELTYWASSDTLPDYVLHTDSIALIPKKLRAKLLEEERKAYEEAEKKFIKEQKRLRRKKQQGDDEEEEPLPAYQPPMQFLKVNVAPTGSVNINATVSLSFEEPIESYSPEALHLEHKADTLWESIPFLLQPAAGELRSYDLLAEWRPAEEYRLTVDSAAFHGLYGLHNKAEQFKFKFRSLDEYGTLFFNIAGVPDSTIVQLLDAQGKPKRSEWLVGGEAAFYFLLPGKYYFRMVVDENHNGKWDTGNYAEQRQPEAVYYYPKELNVKALWDYTQDDWKITHPLEKQKPLAITKQKPEQKKKRSQEDGQNNNRR